MVKKKYVIIAFIMGILLSCTGVYAASTIIKSKDVSYDKTSSGGAYDNVQDAIDELYEKSGLLKENWIDKTLNGADPVLDVEESTKKLIPITIDDDGTVHYANLKTKWYDYSKKLWANAVLLVDNPSNKDYKTGDIILEKDIESYFVWIPRFSYKIWNLANSEDYNSAPNITTLNNTNYETSPQNAFNKPRIIDIKFGNVDTNPKMNESEATLNNYYTHPAFTLGDKDLNGIWVGKFEVGYNQNGDNGNPIEDTSSWTTSKATINFINNKRVIVKPNVNSWQNNTIQNFFLSLYNYNRSLESHMMKNTEWGAVAYLSHSIYGIGSNININNAYDLVTGIGANANTNQEKRPGDYGNSKQIDKTQPYNSGAGYLASTTGNITGIYDMCGGVTEYMAAYRGETVGESGFTDDTELKTTYKNYVDIYAADSDSTTYTKRILGDATGEMGPFYQYYDGDGTAGQGSTPGTLRYHSSWYTSLSSFINTNSPWFVRGGHYADGGLASQFYFTRGTGTFVSFFGTRLVLATK